MNHKHALKTMAHLYNKLEELRINIYVYEMVGQSIKGGGVTASYSSPKYSDLFKATTRTIMRAITDVQAQMATIRTRIAQLMKLVADALFGKYKKTTPDVVVQVMPLTEKLEEAINKRLQEEGLAIIEKEQRPLTEDELFELEFAELLRQEEEEKRAFRQQMVSR